MYKNDSSGKLGIIYTYKDDKKNGPYKRFYNSGKLYSLGTYRNDTLVYHVYYFEENGDSIKIYYTWKGEEDFSIKNGLTMDKYFMQLIWTVHTVKHYTFGQTNQVTN